MDKINQVIAEFSIFPLGHGETSVSRFVAAAISAFKDVPGLDYEVTPMGTILAAKDLDTIFKAAGLAHEAIVAMGIKRVESILRIDDRRDKPRIMQDKTKAVQDYIKQGQ